MVIRSYVITIYWRANGSTKNKNKLTEGKAFNFSIREDLDAISMTNFLSKFLATFLVSDVGKGKVSRHSSPPYLTSIVNRFLI